MDKSHSEHKYHHHDKHHKSRNKYPNAYLEDWSDSIVTAFPTSVNDRKESSAPVKASEETSKRSSKKPSLINEMVSIILSTSNNQKLSRDKSYNIRFNNGMVEGSGVSIDDIGTNLTFENEGSYRFELCGEAVAYSDVEVKLIFHSDKFTDDIKPFSEIKVPKEDNKLILRGIPTILPINKGQKMTIRLVPANDENILLFAGTRLLLYRVA